MHSWLRNGVNIVLFTLAAVVCVPESRADIKVNASFYIDTFGRIDPRQNPRVERAHTIFDRLKRVTGSDSMSAELVLINTSSRPWAIALADGNVVLSRGALDIIYASGDSSGGDAWLAFVLGHELAHLESRDLWQQHVFASLSALPDLEASTLLDVQQAMGEKIYDTKAWRDRELKADEFGYVIAALAGFEVQRIFSDEVGRKAFLEVWEDATGSNGDTHYSAQIRTRFLRSRLIEAEGRLDQFKLGAMLAHTGGFDDALAVFEDFQRYFPSRAVLTNLGYVHLQLARKEMPVQLAYRFWLPTLLEPDSGLRIPSRSLSNGLTPATKSQLQDAVRYLEQAYQMDPDDDVACVNLSTAYSYLGNYFRARATVEEGLARYPDNETLTILKALILVDQEPDIDMWPRAVETLKSLLRTDEKSVAVLFNLARLHQERARHNKAESYWVQLDSVAAKLPTAFRYQVCAALGTTCDLPGDDSDKLPVELLDSARLPLLPGDRLQKDTAKSLPSEASLLRWQVQNISGSTIKSSNMTAFAFDGLVEHVSYRMPQQKMIEQFESLLTPLDISQFGINQLQRFSGGVSLLKIDGKVVEMWLAR